jgi:hypothetical protein
MKMTFTGTCVAALAAIAITASAQQPPQPAPQPAPAPAPSATARLDKDVTLTGCIKAGAEAGSFELSNIKKGEASTGPSLAKDAKIALAPAAGVELAPHVGHTVEVKGTWSAAAATSSPTPTAPAGEAKAAKNLTVSSVKMVSATCSTGTN